MRGGPRRCGCDFASASANCAILEGENAARSEAWSAVRSWVREADGGVSSKRYLKKRKEVDAYSHKPRGECIKQPGSVSFSTPETI